MECSHSAEFIRDIGIHNRSWAIDLSDLTGLCFIGQLPGVGWEETVSWDLGFPLLQAELTQRQGRSSDTIVIKIE